MDGLLVVLSIHYSLEVLRMKEKSKWYKILHLIHFVLGVGDSVQKALSL